MTETAQFVDWAKIRAVWEGDPTLTFKAISLKLGGKPTKQAIGQRAKREGWTRVDPSQPEIRKAIEKRADEKSAKRAKSAPVAEVLPPEEPPAPAGAPSPLAVDHSIEARAGLLDRHRKEWQIPRNRIYQASQEVQDRAKAFAMMKEGKIMAEALSIIQSGERKAWGLDGDPTLVVRVIPPSRRDVCD